MISELTDHDLDAAALAHYATALSGPDGIRAATARGLITPTGAITVAGAVGFASTPDRWLPQHVLRVIRYHGRHRLVGTRQNIVSDDRFSYPLERLIPEVAASIDASLPTRRALTSDGTFETVGLIPQAVGLVPDPRPWQRRSSRLCERASCAVSARPCCALRQHASRRQAAGRPSG